MAKKICKCAVCSIEFDRNAIQAVKYNGRRYAHQTCFPEGELVPMEAGADPDLTDLKEYINTLFGNKANNALINKQIKTYHETNGMSYGSIKKTLQYFYEVEHNPIDCSKGNGGIGIVPFCEVKAKNYFLSLFYAQQANEDKVFTSVVKEYTIKPPTMKGTKHRLLEWELEDEEQ